MKKLALIFVVVFLSYSLIKNVMDYRRNLQFHQNYRDAYLKENKTNITLKTQLLKNNSLVQLEKTIRNKLNLLQPNEVAIIPNFPTPTPPAITPTPLPNYQQWWQLFTQNTD